MPLDELLTLTRTGSTSVLVCARTILPDQPLVAMNQLTLDTRLAAIDGQLVAEALLIHPHRTGWYPVSKHWDLPAIIIM